MIDKYCVYIYSLHYVQREYIYHTTNRREVGIRTQLPSAFYHTDVRTDCAPLIKVGGRSDVSDLPYDCIPKGPPDGQTSINQILLFVLPLVVAFLYGSVESLCLCSIESLSLHTGEFDDYFDDVVHVM